MNATTKTAQAVSSINTPEQPIKKTFTVASALALLWEKASETLTQPELEWFAVGATEQISSRTHALSAVLENTACLVSSDKSSGGFQDTASTSELLFNLHNQLDAIAGLADIADVAGDMARWAAKKEGGAA
jgi:hypothetical protein